LRSGRLTSRVSGRKTLGRRRPENVLRLQTSCGGVSRRTPSGPTNRRNSALPRRSLSQHAAIALAASRAGRRCVGLKSPTMPANRQAQGISGRSAPGQTPDRVVVESCAAQTVCGHSGSRAAGIGTALRLRHVDWCGSTKMLRSVPGPVWLDPSLLLRASRALQMPTSRHAEESVSRSGETAKLSHRI